MWQAAHFTSDFHEAGSLALGSRARAGETRGEPAAFFQLAEEGFGRRGYASVEENHTVRALFGAPAREAAFDNLDIGKCERAQICACRFGKFGLWLNAHHFPPKPREDRGGIARGAAHIEDSVAGFDGGELDESRQDHGSEERARRRSVDRGKDFDPLVDIGKRADTLRYEALARERAHGGEEAPVRHLVRPELGLDHGKTPARKIDHRALLLRSNRGPDAS